MTRTEGSDRSVTACRGQPTVKQYGDRKNMHDIQLPELRVNVNVTLVQCNMK